MVVIGRMGMKSYMEMSIIKKMIKHGVDVNPMAEKYDENRSGNNQIGNLFEKSMLSKFIHF